MTADSDELDCPKSLLPLLTSNLGTVGNSLEKVIGTSILVLEKLNRERCYKEEEWKRGEKRLSLSHEKKNA